MGLLNGKLYQDPLFGAKVLTPLAVRIIDTPEFQRLSGLRQLGFSDLVYRGAHHTRFEHSVGTYFICRTIMRRIVQNHERLGLDHPGECLSRSFRDVPGNAKLGSDVVTFQSLWRGLTEVVSIAALLHDIGHVPFGHTLEDEFAGIFPKHDKLAGPRLYVMLFEPTSELAAVFDQATPWIGEIPNELLRRLIYVILNWKEKIDPPEGFQKILEKEIDGVTKQAPGGAKSKLLGRLEQLRTWHADLLHARLFSPFMSDIIGNTICSDLLDYLPRDRTYLGMEARYHSRLQRYFTIREGSLYPPEEGLRMSIMVTRGAHGGQRRDVATSVLDIMRERYEMAERVYYHHKKAAASAMLAKLVELTPPSLRPRDDDQIYPAAWDRSGSDPTRPPHMMHLSDASLIEYLDHVEIGAENRQLQRRLYSAIVSRRRDMYQTLLVVDCDLVNAGTRTVRFIADDLRGADGEPASSARRALERALAAAADATDGDVIIYCPSPSMQSKEVDARMEIAEKRVLPLRIQEEAFTYHNEVELLKQYYASLWRAYIFVAPEIFADEARCKAIVDAFCEHYKLPRSAAYSKVRKHTFQPSGGTQPVVDAQPADGGKPSIQFPEVAQLVAAGLAERSDVEADLKAVLRPKAILRVILPATGKERLEKREERLFYNFVREDISPMESPEFVAWLDSVKHEFVPPLPGVGGEGSVHFKAGDIIAKLRETVRTFRQKKLI